MVFKKQKNHDKGENVAPLICAADAFTLRNATAAGIWSHMGDSGKRKLASKFKPASYLRSLQKVTALDIEVLQAYWLGLNTENQEQELEWWTETKTLTPENWEKEERRKITGGFENIHDGNLKKIANRVLRGEALYEELKAINRNPESMVEAIARLSSTLVVPVGTENSKMYLYMNFLTSNIYPWASRHQATTDDDAYKAFYEYSVTMKETICQDYLTISNGGVRSLNPYLFNSLVTLRSTGDHPAALLLGCRSGVQYTILSEDGTPIGIVAHYFPFYGFFSDSLGITGNRHLSPLVSAAWRKSKNVRREASEEAWKYCWKQCAKAKRTACPHISSCPARIFLSPFRDSNPDLAERIGRHLKAIVNYGGSPTKLGKKMHNQLLKNENKRYASFIENAEDDFYGDELRAVGDWVSELYSSDLVGDYELLNLSAELEDEHKKLIELVASELTSYQSELNLTVKNQKQLTNLINTSLWEISKTKALKMKKELSLGSKFNIKDTGPISVIINMMHWEFTGEINTDLKSFKTLQITASTYDTENPNIDDLIML